MVLHEGWAILTLADDRVLAGHLRLENVGIVQQWALDVPANGVHHGYTAILSPHSIVAVSPCMEEDAVKYGRSISAAVPASAHPTPNAQPAV